MKRRVLCSFIVVVMLFALCVMCACDGNDNGNDNAKQVSLKEGMTLKELHDFFKTVTNFTYDSDYSEDGHSDEVLTERWTEKGRTQVGMSDATTRFESWLFCEDNRYYGLLKETNTKTGEVTCSSEVKNMTKEEFDRYGSVKQWLADFYSDCEDENVEWHIENGKLIIKDMVWHLTYTVYNFNTTKWVELPEEFKNYKDLPLTK